MTTLSSSGTTGRVHRKGRTSAEGAVATGTCGAEPRVARLSEAASATASSCSGTGLALGCPPPDWGDDTAGGRRARRRSSPPAVAECAAAQYTAGEGGAAVGPALAWDGAGPNRARSGAEAGGLRTILDVQRTAVAAPRGGDGQNSSRVELRLNGRYDSGFSLGRSNRIQ